ncbi:Protein sel-1 -like protein 3 Suppressor of lin-12-like protein 3 [Channa argus]|uniref:Protein sel-1-like protein 3 Suppressor of lin-12-like protein 3 n=1 Tax=Channa argus TaxID=215402 RepID=A0A6G1PLM0_CHAAH|nr:Protein sel-1 -like protein 3 Suppressor of lin-12-like protein 3 [Channa argus]
MSACSGGGGVHAKQDRFSGLQEEMDQQHTSSLQDPPDIIDMLKFPLASTGERFGAVRRFQPFIDETLESARLHAVAQPSLIGALGDDCLHAEYKHTQGIDWFPKNLDMAYGYYVNAGAQTSTDTCRIHDKKQYTPEHIYLSNPEDLNALTDETSDIFQYLKLQAERGDLQSQGSINALNGLVWYHGNILSDHRNAVKYFEQAANGSDDGIFNLGIYHLNGKNPKSLRKNELFLSASRFGHVTASVEAAWYLPTGSLEGLSQDVERAVICPRFIIFSGLHYLSPPSSHVFYRVANRQEAFVKYFLAAETGPGLAQSNGAHLCKGIYNLVVLGQQGHALSLSIHGLFNVSRHEGMDVVVEKILKRCVETENEKAVTPCSLALLGVQMGKALRRMTQNSAQLLLNKRLPVVEDILIKQGRHLSAKMEPD